MTSAHAHACGRLEDGQALRLRLRARRARRRQPDAHVDAAVAQIQRVRMPLRPVSENRHLAPLDQRQVGIRVVIHLRHHSLQLNR